MTERVLASTDAVAVRPGVANGARGLFAVGAQAASLPRWLAPLRGVTIRAFRLAFAAPLREAGFVGAVAPFIPANPGIRVNARMLADILPPQSEEACAAPLPPLVPQVITRHPDALRTILRAFKDRGFERADLNAGCPFPMIVRRGRGSGLFKTPDVLEALLAVGCEEMGAGRFSLKIRLGLTRADELLSLMPRLNRYPLAAMTVHARTARQMYEGTPDIDAFAAVAAASSNPVVYNGDIGLSSFHLPPSSCSAVMVGRGFVRALGQRAAVRGLLADYINRSCRELAGERPVLGRLKELIAYWRDQPAWQRLWPLIKICHTVEELRTLIA